MLRCPKCGSGNIIADRFSETGERCLMCGTEPAFSPRTAVPSQKKTNIAKEESMSRGKDYPCKRPGCTKGGYFHGYCKNHFPEAYGVAWEDYLKNRAFKGEKPHLVAARLKDIDGSKVHRGSEPGIATATAVMLPQDLWNKVEQLAAAESRTPNQQVIHMLRCALDGERPVAKIMIEISDRSLKERMLHLVQTSAEIRAAFIG